MLEVASILGRTERPQLGKYLEMDADTQRMDKLSHQTRPVRVQLEEERAHQHRIPGFCNRRWWSAGHDQHQKGLVASTLVCNH